MNLRPVDHPADVPALDQLFEVVFTADRHWPLGEHKYLDLVRGNHTDSVGIVGEEEGQIIAYVHLTPNRAAGGWGMEMATHPLHRDDVLFSVLLSAAQDEVVQAGGSSLHYWVHASGVIGVLDAHGFIQDRELRQLRRPLPIEHAASFPPGVDVRGFRPGVDEEAWLAVNNLAFAGHPENGNWTRDILEEREQVEWFDAAGFRMAWAGSRLAAFNWTKVHDAGMGEIYVIAVHPDFQGMGLGRAIALDGLRYLNEVRGCTVAMLYVDASNEGGLALYTRLGFHLDHIDRAFLWTS